MIKVVGNYYKRPLNIREPLNYEIFLEVDSIYETDMPIQQSNDLILSAIHLKYKISYFELDTHFSVDQIVAILDEDKLAFIKDKIQNDRFISSLDKGLNLSGTSNWEDSSNRLGVALEILIKLKLGSEKIPYSDKATQGQLIRICEDNGIIERGALKNANIARISSSHDADRLPEKNDYLDVFNCIYYFVERCF